MREKSENNETRVKTLANKNRFNKRKLTLDEMIDEFERESKENAIKKESKKKRK